MRRTAGSENTRILIKTVYGSTPVLLGNSKNYKTTQVLHHLLRHGQLHSRSFAEQDGFCALTCRISPCVWPTSKLTMISFLEGLQQRFV